MRPSTTGERGVSGIVKYFDYVGLGGGMWISGMRLSGNACLARNDALRGLRDATLIDCIALGGTGVPTYQRLLLDDWCNA